MDMRYLVQTGLFGEVNRFEVVAGIPLPQGTSVVCRTPRGLEVGTVLTSDSSTNTVPVAGQILRPVSAQDRLILERLERFKRKAIESCEQMLAERNISATLLDAEHLFDGKHLFFYFLGPEPPELDTVLADLAKLYDHKVGFSRFATRLAEGCGPGCGTTRSGCGTSGGCAGCPSGSCGAKPAATSPAPATRP